LKEYYLIIFENTIQVLIAEEEIKKERMKYKIIPTPTEIVKSCGLSILLQDIASFSELNLKSEIKVKGIYSIENGKYKEVIV